MEQNSKKERTRKWGKYATVLLIALLLIYACVDTYLQNKNAISLVCGENQLEITDPGGAASAVPYRDIVNAELVTEADFGAPVAGMETDRWLYGLWENDIWGIYTLCIGTDAQSCIAVYTEEDVYVIGYGSGEDTAVFYAELCQKLS